MLQRQASDQAVTMLRQVLSDDQQQEFCRAAVSRFDELRRSMQQGDYVVVGQILNPAEPKQDVVARLAAFLNQCDGIEVANSPHVSG